VIVTGAREVLVVRARAITEAVLGDLDDARRERRDERAVVGDEE
jgi:hypothetical protein